MSPRFLRFNGVSAAGIGVQLVTIWFLANIAHANYAAATLVGVTAAVAHNFLWHWHWTWADRRYVGRSFGSTFVRFALANGAVSLAGNLLLMAVLVGGAGLAVVPANLIAIAACGLVNYWIGETIVFRQIYIDDLSI